MENIKTNRLLLRKVNYSDIDDIHEYASNEEVVKYMLFGPNTFEESKEYVNLVIEVFYKEIPLRHYEYAIEFENHLIGCVSICLNEKLDKGELGWILNPLYHRQGIMKEAATALINFVNTKVGVNSFISRCDSRNVSSYKLMESLGMKLDHINKDTIVDKKSGLHKFDEFVYQLHL